MQPLARTDNVRVARRFINQFLKKSVSRIPNQSRILDIGPEPDSLSTSLFSKKGEYVTLDITPESQPSLCADICHMPHVPSESFDVILCIEVLEHTRNPFHAIAELHRILKKNGLLLLTTPFNLRIHGPPPDCWRFTEEGLTTLLGQAFRIIELTSLRPWVRKYMPIEYALIAEKNSAVGKGTNGSLVYENWFYR
ncbi:MAG: methyltransferase domain-containing protein [Elusimicrobia bacterium]|nr:methyltransferase domain-containing protein [Elusimicrobiota bacterium]MBD3412643.1 methyltransferase domain-containing protein [Elusimicrobiota bacterium]